MIQVLLIAIGGAIGAALRYAVGRVASKTTGSSAALTGTLFSNLIGCFFVGIVLAWTVNNTTLSQEVILFLTVGILGSLTTFSTFALESYQLLDRGDSTKLMLYLFLQVVIAFLLTAGGFALYQIILGG